MSTNLCESPLYLNNEELQDALDQKRILTLQYAGAVKAVAGMPGNPSLADRKLTLKWELEDVNEQIQQITDDIKKLQEAIDERISRRSNLSYIEASAIQDLEKGDYSAALENLRKAKKESFDGSINDTISINQLIIAILKACGINRKRDREICAYYEDNLQLVKENRLDPAIIRDYPTHLIQRKKYATALKVHSTLDRLYRLADKPMADRAALKEERAQVCHVLGETQLEEKSLLSAHLKYFELTLAVDDNFVPLYLKSCVNLGNFYIDTISDPSQAKEYLREAVRGYETLIRNGDETLTSDLAVAYVANARLRRRMGKASDLKEAAALYEKALSVLRQDAEKDLVANGDLLSESLHGLASIYSGQAHPDEALPLLEEAVDVLTRLSEAKAYQYDMKLKEAKLQLHVTEAMTKNESFRSIKANLAKVKELNAKAIKLGRKGEDEEKNKEQEKLLAEAYEVCERLEAEGVAGMNMADVYCGYADYLTGEEALDCRMRGWDIYVSQFPRNRYNSLQRLAIQLDAFDEIYEKLGNHEDMLPLAAQIESLCGRLNTEEISQMRNLLIKIYEILNRVYKFAKKPQRAEKAHRRVEELKALSTSI